MTPRKELIAPWMAGDCVCGEPVAAHFNAHHQFIPCEQVAARRDLRSSQDQPPARVLRFHRRSQ